MKHLTVLVFISLGVLLIFGMEEQNIIIPTSKCIEAKNSTIPTHDDIVKNIRKCSCGLKFDDNIQIQNHVIDKHYSSDLNQFICQDCAFRFGELNDFLIHCTTRTEELLKCNSCNLSFKRNFDVKKHLDLHREFQKEFYFLSRFGPFINSEDLMVCPSCFTEYCSLLRFLKHIKIHVLNCDPNF